MIFEFCFPQLLLEGEQNEDPEQAFLASLSKRKKKMLLEYVVFMLNFVALYVHSQPCKITVRYFEKQEKRAARGLPPTDDLSELSDSASSSSSSSSDSSSSSSSSSSSDSRKRKDHKHRRR